MRPVVAVHDLVVVVLPSRLVLLRAVVMVDAEQHRAGGFGRRAQVDGGLPAPRPDLDEGRRGRVSASGTPCGVEQCRALVVGHEPLGGAGVGEELFGAVLHLDSSLVVDAHPRRRLHSGEDSEAGQNQARHLADGGRGEGRAAAPGRP